MEEYTVFFERVEKKQNEKMEALLSGELGRIEESIVMQQALDKQISNMENKRMELFQSWGKADATFKAVIEQTKKEEQKHLLELYQRLDQALNSIKYLNQNAMKLAQTKLVKMGATPQESTSSRGNPYHSVGTDRNSRWNTKI